MVCEEEGTRDTEGRHVRKEDKSNDGRLEEKVKKLRRKNFLGRVHR